MQSLSTKHHLIQTIRLSLPLIISQVILMGMTFVDTVMAGQLGATTLAAVSIFAWMFRKASSSGSAAALKRAST